MPLFDLTRPSTPLLPIVISVPHAGIAFPADIQAELKPSLLPPDDTDWFVHQLYDFATELGLPIIKANYSRWVVDLNRNPDSSPLYHDGRVLTGLCTSTTFLGEPIYRDERAEVAPTEVARRKSLYFGPYHAALQQLLDETKAQFGQVLLWDCHSIRRVVSAIHNGPFPDLILGSADETSASQPLIEQALQQLGSGRYSLSHNTPFKGGYITRHFGRPEAKQHALQLEMSKDVYMDDAEQAYDPARAEQIRAVLRRTLRTLGESLRTA
ncbi:N-formylglutamate amidohydrolase [Hymenobacter properus]|uniref:N-formylglutamate amidohydrolase n=1 Tax=Hymenobacter properus TaxID=2791026 RepID=A0A931BCH7_9BACT|nr:N-formylglutamate amidohydrolase [Hymenobacter properus]MBF9140076.1 N-formylglutamate amidohydrolase [Hymenobacter properus]MBR7718883.1 N-formylglutamate amidohydrolase [Microvirga sp. SRT04]